MRRIKMPEHVKRLNRNDLITMAVLELAFLVGGIYVFLQTQNIAWPIAGILIGAVISLYTLFRVNARIQPYRDQDQKAGR